MFCCPLVRRRTQPGTQTTGLRVHWLGLLMGACALVPSLSWAQASSAAAPTAAAETSVAAAAAAPLPPASLFYRNPDVADAKLSPSGKLLAVTLQRGGRLALGLLRLDTGQAQPLVHYSDHDVDSFHWVGDTHLVYTLADLKREAGADRLAPGLFALDLADRQVRQLVRLRQDFVTGRPAPGREPLAYNHQLLAVPNDGSHEVVVGKLVWGSDWAVQEVVPLRLNVRDGRARSVGLGMPEGATRWLFDAQGEPRLAAVQRGGQTRLHWRGVGASGWQLLAAMPSTRMAWQPHSVDARGGLYVTVPEGAGGYQVLKRFDFQRAQPADEVLVSTPGFDFNGALVQALDAPTPVPADAAASAPLPAAAGQPVLGVHAETDAATTVWFDARLQAWQAEADRLLPGRVNRLSCRRCHGPEPVVLVRSWSDREPGALYLYHPARQQGAWQALGRQRADVDPRAMATLDFHRVPTRDGQRMPLWLTLPAGAAAQAAPTRRPAVVLVHGGPWVRGGHWRWDADAQFLASRGYVVIEPEFRGSTGYGARWFEAGRKQWGRAMQDDLADALQWAVAQGHVDKSRVCIAGASYGGYAALMGPVRHPGLFRCVVSWVGVTDLLLRYDQGFMSDLPDEGARYTLPELMGDPNHPAERAMLQDNSPVHHAARIDVPVFMAYGAEDRRVPLAHGERMRDALTAAGRPPTWVVYADEGHGWSRPENRFDFAQRLEKFLAQHLK